MAMTRLAVVFQSIDMPIGLGIPIHQGPTLSPGEVSVSQITPLKLLDTALFLAQHIGLTPGQLTRMDPLLDTTCLLPLHSMQGCPGKGRHGQTKGQKNEYGFAKMFFHVESSYICLIHFQNRGYRVNHT
jgi:hypothetical protein